MSSLEAGDDSKGKDNENLAEVKPKKNNCLMITLIVISCVVVVGLALGLSLGLTIGKKSKKPANADRRPIAVIVAMHSELSELLTKIGKYNTTTVKKFKFYEGTINDNPVIICHCGISEINAGIATLLAIQRYNPRAIISEGTAGGYGNEVHRSDIVIGEKAVNLASFKTGRKKQGEGSNSLEWQMVTFIEGKDDALSYQLGNENLVKLAKKVNYKGGNVHYGVVGSSDNWNSEADRILFFKNNLGALCEEMECFSVFSVANDFGVPVIAIKVISNNDMIGEAHDISTAKGAQDFTYDLILQILNE
ncbi:hypothetical protein M9Y10_015985 [Tritrichomonas musculus]|uniref:Nucleoside phosphorylase domain-containing protein n=1 Tax=Tritrichomonas musculus TaxID=1915356 RepID=A0ABR2I5D2_9EUKA